MREKFPDTLSDHESTDSPGEYDGDPIDSWLFLGLEKLDLGQILEASFSRSGEGLDGNNPLHTPPASQNDLGDSRLTLGFEELSPDQDPKAYFNQHDRQLGRNSPLGHPEEPQNDSLDLLDLNQLNLEQDNGLPEIFDENSALGKLQKVREDLEQSKGNLETLITRVIAPKEKISLTLSNSPTTILSGKSSLDNPEEPEDDLIDSLLLLDLDKLNLDQDNGLPKILDKNSPLGKLQKVREDLEQSKEVLEVLLTRLIPKEKIAVTLSNNPTALWNKMPRQTDFSEEAKEYDLCLLSILRDNESAVPNTLYISSDTCMICDDSGNTEKISLAGEGIDLSDLNAGTLETPGFKEAILAIVSRKRSYSQSSETSPSTEGRYKKQKFGMG